ncbi:MAG: hypothetical protein G01um101456_35 [Parcubacteria group bacterium Gr01-1014_56]|nr:MAG: hypothetical protein G01um101456_35 [Parcubacteria group bacterium Gr01-1014_56]
MFAITLLATAVPTLASAQYYYDGYNNYNYYPYQNCGTYTPYSSSYWNNCNTLGSLTVYVQVNNQYGGYRSPSDFTIYVSGANPSERYFAGSQNGTTVRLEGSYSASVYNQVGYNPTYSSGCSGSLVANETRTCYVTLTSAYTGNYPYHYPPYQQYPYNYQYQYQQPVVYQPVTYVASYTPSLPNTGYEPMSQSAVAFSLALILTLFVLLFPYVRKSFAAVIR